MTPPQKRLFVALAAAIALTRLGPIAHTFFDWDEALFVLAVREYDVVMHNPHPPGYPLFVAAAKLFHLAGLTEFRALQVVVILGAMCLFPALFFFAREVGFDFGTAAGGAAIFAFLPNVWIYGGTGFSDVPSTAAVFAACALLLRGRSDTRAFVAGAALLGVAAGMRLPNLLIGAIPAVIATASRARARAWGAIAGAVTIGAAILLASYLGAALATGSIGAYVEAVRGQSDYVRSIDSFRNPERPPLTALAKRFFIWPIQQRQQMVALTALATASFVASAARRRRPPLLTAAIFAPAAMVSWLNLDYQTSARYAIAYMAVHALLAADAAALIARGNARVQAALCAAVAAVFVVWTWPAARLQRSGAPPPVAALQWVRDQTAPNEEVRVYWGIGPHAQVILPDRRRVEFDTGETAMTPGKPWVVDIRAVEGARNFVWPRDNPLWKIVRGRNFEASARRAGSALVFADGWYGDEGGFRWMAGESLMFLPPLRRNGRLTMRMYVPRESVEASAQIEVWVNGALIERFPAQPIVEKEWIVGARADRPSSLRIRTSATANPARSGTSGDDRELGLGVDRLSWMPVP